MIIIQYYICWLKSKGYTCVHHTLNFWLASLKQQYISFNCGYSSMKGIKMDLITSSYSWINSHFLWLIFFFFFFNSHISELLRHDELLVAMKVGTNHAGKLQFLLFIAFSCHFFSCPRHSPSPCCRRRRCRSPSRPSFLQLSLTSPFVVDSIRFAGFL